MTEEIDGVLFTDGQNRVFLHPPQLYPGGYGFHHQVDLVGGPFRGAIDATSYEGIAGFRSFRDQLIALYKDLRGNAKLSCAYENLRVALNGDGFGHIQVEVQAIAGPCRDIELNYNFNMDQTQLPAVIAAIERLFLA